MTKLNNVNGKKIAMRSNPLIIYQCMTKKGNREE